MGDTRSRTAAAASAAAALCFVTAAGAQGVSPKRDALPLGMSGSIVQYEESGGSGIVYLEAKGAMLTSATAPVQRATDAKAAPTPAKVVPAAGQAKAREATSAPASAPSRVAQRRVADPKP